MAELKPAYLIHGDDHGAIAERRAGLRALAEAADGGAGSVEVLEGDGASPARVARALAAMTLALGRRVIIVEGVERWRQNEVEADLVGAMEQMPAQTTIAMFAREEARSKAPAALAQAVRRAGGQVVSQMTVKPWELSKWVREQASRLGLALDSEAAGALVAQVGERQQRLLRELEKLALARGAEGGPSRSVSAEDVELEVAHSAEWRAYRLADALVAGDAREATLSYLRVRGQGERLSGLVYLIAQRLREALAISARLSAGESAADLARGLRMPARAARRLVLQLARTDPDRLRRALSTLADLELDSRGGAPVARERGALAGLSEDTIAVRAIERMTA